MQPKYDVVVIGGGHNNMHNYESYHELLSQIFAKDKVEFDREKSSIQFFAPSYLVEEVKKHSSKISDNSKDVLINFIQILM